MKNARTSIKTKINSNGNMRQIAKGGTQGINVNNTFDIGPNAKDGIYCIAGTYIIIVGGKIVAELICDMATEIKTFLVALSEKRKIRKAVKKASKQMMEAEEEE